MRYLLFVFFITTTSFLSAQNQNDKNSFDYTCLICKTGDHLHISPYDFSVKKEAPFWIVGANSIIVSEIIRFNNDTKPYTEEELNQLDRNDINPFDRPTTYKYNPEAARLSDFLRTGVIILPALFLANHHTRDDIGGLAMLTIEVVGINWGITNGTKHLVNRTRPYVYNENAPLDLRTNNQSRLSFFSGHTSHTAAVSFLFAKVINDYHPDITFITKIGLWGLAGSIPAVTAYLRVQSGKHYPTDVMAGYFIGAGLGWLVPHLHKIKSRINLAPYSFQDANGMSLTYKF